MIPYSYVFMVSKQLASGVKYLRLHLQLCQWCKHGCDGMLEAKHGTYVASIGAVGNCNPSSQLLD